MTPFILSEVLAGKPVCTRDGRKVLRIVHWPELGELSVIASIKGEEQPASFRVDGTFSLDKRETTWDLVMAQETRTVWLNCTSEGMWLEYPRETAATASASAINSHTGKACLVIAHKVEVPA